MVLTYAERELKFRLFIKLRAKNTTKNNILRLVGISRNTYYDWCRIDDNEEVFITLPRSGGPIKKTTEEDDRVLREVFLQNNWSDMSAIRQLPDIEANQRISELSDRTISNRLRDQGVRHRVAAIKERLQDFHKQRRMRYANDLIHWTLCDWSRVIFIDEFSICTGDAGRLWVWRETGARYEERNIALNQNTHRFSVSFIACFSFHGMGPIHRVERLNKESYTEFLEDSLIPYIERYFDDGNVLLLHDNHPVHTSNHVNDWINEYIGDVQDFVVPHPSLSPDLNPVENVGAMLKSLVRNERPVINSREELWDTVERAQQKMSNVEFRLFFINLLNSMPNRLKEVLDARGGHSSY